MAPKRSLFLHLSALSEAEYSFYVEALRDILDDGDGDGPKIVLSDEEIENRRVSLPVVRAWMKGRFRDLGPGEIDKVLHVFASQMPQKEMSGGQLLAALRLLMHARRGRDVSEGNVFVQVDPPSSPTATRSPPLSTAKPVCEVECPTPGVLASLPKSGPANTNPFFAGPSLQSVGSINLPPPNQSSDSPRRASLSSAPALPPVTSKPRVDGMGVAPGSTNPFLQRAKTHSGTYEPNSSGSGRTPPLPPRKPSHIPSSNAPHKPPPIPAKLLYSAPPHQPTSSNSASTSSSSQQNAPPSSHHVTPLMQQSLLASRIGASLKRAQEEAVRTRVLEVIRSSSEVMVSQSKERDRTKSSSRSPDKGARRPVPHPPRRTVVTTAKSDSGAPSEASLAEVASARLSSRSHMRTRTASPDRISLNSNSSSEFDNGGEKTPAKGRQLSTSEQFSPPPTHPARRPSARSSSSRGRHIRSPSYQSYSGKHTPTAGPSPFTKSTSSTGIRDNQSPSPSPSPSPVSPANSRSMRSQSLHQPSSPSDMMNSNSASPLPPPRRQRPESAQFATRPHLLDADRDATADLDPSSPFSNSFGVQQPRSSGGVVSSMAARFDKTPFHLGREDESERDKDRHKDAFASLHRTFSALQERAQPTITRARFKAEAGILAPRRGFVPNGRDYHMAGEDGDRLVIQSDDANDGGMDFSPSTDNDYDENVFSGDETIRYRGRGRNDNVKKPVFDRDNLKLPEGEGWTPL